MKFIEIIALLLLVSSFNCLAQDSLQLELNPTWGINPIANNSSFVTKDGTSITISQLKFYLSDVCTSSSFSEKNYYLFDLSDSSSFTINIPKEKSDHLFFKLGIDSLTNNLGVQAGDLDPMNGMYWTWQSGYINVKLEGTYSKDQMKEDFTFHLGGFSGKKNAVQHVQLSIPSNKNQIILNMDLAMYFNQLRLEEQNTIMSPSTEAVSLSKTMADIFSVERK